MKRFTQAVVGLSLMLGAVAAHAGVILAPTAVVQNSMGELNCCGDFLVDMYNQQGLSSNYVSGVTDFDTFTSAGVTHSGGDSTSWLSDGGVYSGFLIFDLGAAYNLDQFVMWNGASGISASVKNFSLSTSLVSDFSVSTLAGNFTGHQSHYGATVYDMADTYARYVKLEIGGNFGNGCCTAIGDIAFDATSAAPVSVPEPASLALFGLGLTGLVLSRRKRS